MTTQENRKLIEEYVTAWTKADRNVLERVLADDHKVVNGMPGITDDKNGQIQMAEIFHKAFPDANVRIAKACAEGNDVCAHLKMTGTHKGEFMGVQPSNKKVDVDVVVYATVRDGKIAEDVTGFDTLDLMTTIGAVPELGTATH